MTQFCDYSHDTWDQSALTSYVSHFFVKPIPLSSKNFPPQSTRGSHLCWTHWKSENNTRWLSYQVWKKGNHRYVPKHVASRAIKCSVMWCFIGDFLNIAVTWSPPQHSTSLFRWGSKPYRLSMSRLVVNLVSLLGLHFHLIPSSWVLPY